MDTGNAPVEAEGEIVVRGVRVQVPEVGGACVWEAIEPGGAPPLL